MGVCTENKPFSVPLPLQTETFVSDCDNIIFGITFKMGHLSKQMLTRHNNIGQCIAS